MNIWSRELEVAVEAARQAGELALRYQQGIEAETKSDLSPVTRADREAERLITSILAYAFPDDGFLGEEGANRVSKNGRKWIIDPIDGTRDYVRGNPFWANLIGLEAAGEVVAGVANLPGLGQMYTGARGMGSFRNGQRMHVSSKTTLADSVICFNGFNKLANAPFRPRLLDWLHGTWAVRSYGGAPDSMMGASGQADVWIEPIAAPWDLAPLKVIMEEAGGLFFNFDGGCSIYAGNCCACPPALEGEVRKLLGLES